MGDQVRAWLIHVLRLPPEPQVPPGDGGSVRVFRAAPAFFRYNLARWGLAQLGALTGLIVGIVLVRTFSGTLGRLGFFDVVVWIEIGAWLSFLVQLPFTFALLWLDYDQRWYIVTDRSLRIREGLTRVREQTMTFANIQNMSIQQGPLQRLLGIADVEVHTAGGGSGSGGGGKPGESAGQPMHVGIFRGVDNAPQIRDTIRDRLRSYRDAGLGDLDDVQPATVPAEGMPGAGVPAAADAASAAPSPLLDAAQELLSEARLLRAAADAQRRSPAART